jgi:FKBP-type peptidyl-prolyl cis-trans isomerase (trigger factor)
MVLCYDKSVSESEFDRLIAEFYLSVTDDKTPQEEMYKRQIEHYNKVKNDLRMKKIVTLIIREYNRGKKTRSSSELSSDLAASGDSGAQLEFRVFCRRVVQKGSGQAA